MTWLLFFGHSLRSSSLIMMHEYRSKSETGYVAEHFFFSAFAEAFVDVLAR